MVMQNYSTSFTDIPYKAGTVNLVMKNETAKLLFYFNLATWLITGVWYGNRPERLRRRREQYLVKRNSETDKHREPRYKLKVNWKSNYTREEKLDHSELMPGLESPTCCNEILSPA